MTMSLDIEHTPLNIELIKSTKSNNKAHLKGLLYTLIGVSSANNTWKCSFNYYIPRRKHYYFHHYLLNYLVFILVHLIQLAAIVAGISIEYDRALVSGEKS